MSKMENPKYFPEIKKREIMGFQFAGSIISLSIKLLELIKI